MSVVVGVSSDEVFTGEDRQLLDAIDDDIHGAETDTDYEALSHSLRDDVRDLQAQVRRLTNRLDDLEADVENTADDNGPDGPPLVHYAQIDPSDREDALDTSERIAVTMHEHWDDIAWTLGGGSNYSNRRSKQRIGVDTKTAANAKYNPSKLRHRLKRLLDRDPEWNEIYRGLKQLAVLSGGEEHIDDGTGRAYIVGGRYHYEERATADGGDTKRVCWRVTE